MEIYGTDGTLSYSTGGENSGKIMLIKKNGYAEEKRLNSVLWEKSKSSGKHTDGEIAHFVSCILSGETPITNGRTSTTGLRVIWKLYDAEMKDEVADLRGLGFNLPFIEEPICDFDCDSEAALADYKF
jgi:predicted dehydrogenase